MAKGKPTKQHYVPQCYLREFADHHDTNDGQPCVWIFDRDGGNGRRDKVANVLASNDLYTLRVGGEKSYVIEESLSDLEGKYATVFREKIGRRIPLNDKDHLTLCAFVVVMLHRTLKRKDQIEKMLGELAKRAEDEEKARGLAPKMSLEIKQSLADAHKRDVATIRPEVVNILMNMSAAFLCASGHADFVTSDDPVTMFNPDLQWQQFYGPGLDQKNVQVTIPLSPRVMLCLSWSNLRGYIGWNDGEVEEANRMTVGSCYRYFVSNSPKTRRHWFRRYPKDPIFIMKALKHKAFLRIRKLITNCRTYHAGKRG